MHIIFFFIFFAGYVLLIETLRVSKTSLISNYIVTILYNILINTYMRNCGSFEHTFNIG